MDLSNVVNIVYAILGVGFLIFVHELGHFLAAKKVGIRVETFSIGFQPHIFGVRARFFAIQRGETEYVLGMVPFGGYVKMAGEELHEEKTGSADEFGSKSIPERSLVLVAGSVMNLIFGFLFFVLAFSWGVKFQSPVLGELQPNGPAWNAGLRPGDRIVSLDGDEKTDFEDIVTTIALAGLERPIRLEVERQEGDTLRRFEVTVEPTKDGRLGMPTIGATRTTASRIVGDVQADSPADRAGLRKGDVVQALTLADPEGREVSPAGLPFWRQWSVTTAFAEANPGGAILLQVERDGEQQSVRVPIELSEQRIPLLGVGPRARLVAAIQKDSPAAAVFQRGWEISTLAGEVVERLDASTVLRVAPSAGRIEFSTTTGERGEVDRDELILWLGNQMVITSGRNEIVGVKPGSQGAELGLAPGQRLLRIGTTLVRSPQDLDGQRGSSVELVWWDGVRRRTATVDAADGNPLDLGVELARRPILAPAIPGLPGHRAGLRGGDEVIRINGEPVESWTDLVRGVQGAPRSWYQFWSDPPAQVEITVLRDGAEQDFSIETATGIPRAGFAMRADEVTLEAPLLEACVIGTERAFAWTLRIFLTIKALATREVDASNLAGPIGILDISRRVVAFGFGKFIFFLGLISINLGIFNLLPFPILDGGHLLFLAIEKIKGSPVSERVQGWAFTVAFVLLIGLALFVTFHDLRRLF